MKVVVAAVEDAIRNKFPVDKILLNAYSKSRKRH